MHLAVQGETVKDRDGVLARLGAAHVAFTVGQAPMRHDRWTSLLRELQDRIDPIAPAELDADDDPARRERERSTALAVARLLSAALPACPDIETYLRQLDLDVMLASPHTDPWSDRLDYVIACRRVGLPLAPLVIAEASETAVSGLEPLLQADVRPLRLASTPEPADIAETADAIEAAARWAARPKAASWLLRPVIELILGLRGANRFFEDRLGADLRHGLVIGLLGRAGRSIQDAYARWVFPGLFAVLMAMLPKSRDLFRALMKEQLDAREMSRLAWVEDALISAQRGSGPVFLGPWVGGIGHEVLYWIPMLRWFRKTYQIDKSRVVVISRGGVKQLYTGILGNYLDLFDLVPNKREEYRDDALRNIIRNDMPSPAGKIEKEIYNEAARLVGAERYTSFHPQIMFKLFKRRWVGLAGDSFVDRQTRIQSASPDRGPAEKRLGALPADYVAVNFHFSEELPDTPRNRALVTGFIKRLAEKVEVFLIEPAIDADKGPMADIPTGPRVHRIEQQIRASEILGVQAGVISGSRACVGTFGGMTYLAQALGKAAVGVRAPDATPSEASRELTMIRPDPDGGSIHLIGLDEVDQMIPALADAPEGARAAKLDAAAGAGALVAAKPRRTPTEQAAE